MQPGKNGEQGGHAGPSLRFIALPDLACGLPDFSIRDIAQLTEPPGTDPYARWCDRESP